MFFNGQFLSEFSIFLKTVFSDELIATEYYAYNSVPSVERIKLLTIIEAKWDKTEEGVNAQLFIILSVL